jgi:hypothetical protein
MIKSREKKLFRGVNWIELDDCEELLIKNKFSKMKLVLGKDFSIWPLPYIDKEFGISEREKGSPSTIQNLKSTSELEISQLSILSVIKIWPLLIELLKKIICNCRISGEWIWRIF